MFKGHTAGKQQVTAILCLLLKSHDYCWPREIGQVLFNFPKFQAISYKMGTRTPPND